MMTFVRSYPRRRQTGFAKVFERGPGRARERYSVSLEDYRQSVLSEFRKEKNLMLKNMQRLYPEVVDIRLTGSILKQHMFNEDSDVDVKIVVSPDTNIVRQQEIFYGLLGKVYLGNGVADIQVVPARRRR